MRTTTSSDDAREAVESVGRCLCDEALAMLAVAPVGGRDAVELDEVCQRLMGLTRLLEMREWQSELRNRRAVLEPLTIRKRLRRMAKRARKDARAGRDAAAAKRAAAFVDKLPGNALAGEAVDEWRQCFLALRGEIPGGAFSRDSDAIWLACRRDYGRVRGLGAAWRDGESRLDCHDWQARLIGVYTQLGAVAPSRAVDRESWELLIRLVGDRAALEDLRRHLLVAAGRLSPAFVVPRTIALIDKLGPELEARIAEAYADCFEGRPRSYFAHLRHG